MVLARALAACVFAPVVVEAQTVRSDFCATDGAVRATALSGGTLYIAGDFTHAGKVTPYTGAALLDAAQGEPILEFPRIEGQVHAVAPDGNGGWYVGGQFTAVGGLPRSSIAHVLADNSVSPWDPGADGPVFALALDGHTLYAGGDFVNIGGQPRSRIAALDASTGAATPWDPHALGGRVLALYSSNSVIFAGGDFTWIGGQPRSSLAKIDATGSATQWVANTNGPVRALARDGNKLIVGGEFTTVNGQLRAWLGAVNASNGDLLGWLPNVNGNVRALALSGSILYVGGDFTAFGLQARNKLAALDASSGAPIPWDPGANAAVHALAVGGGVVYAGGDFTLAGGQARAYMVELDAATGVATPWDAGADVRTRVLAVNGSEVFAGGLGGRYGWRARQHIAALDATTGELTPWNPAANGSVFTLGVQGSSVVAGGDFTSIGGQPRRGLAALDGATGAATSWNPDVDGRVTTMILSGANLYLGGDFTSVGGQVRTQLAALDLGTGLPLSLAPSCDSTVLALALSGSTLYAAGRFTSIGGQPRNHIAALDLTTGLVTGWDPNALGSCHHWSWIGCDPWWGCAYDEGDLCTGDVSALAIGGDVVYAGGNFEAMGGQPRSGLAALDAASGQVTSWNPDAGGCEEIIEGCCFEACNDDSYCYRYFVCPQIDALMASGSAVYAGGNFWTISGQPRSGVVALNAQTGMLIGWNPNLVTGVQALASNGSTLYVGTAQGVAAIETQVTAVGLPARSITSIQLRCEPNPFTASTAIRYSIPSRAPVRLDLYDLAGRRVKTLVDEQFQDPGLHQVNLSGIGLPPAMYVCAMRVGRVRTSTKIIRMP